ncbi:FadR/GntR family transcriptional regulator [Polaromonas sp.]|uniref:FadR/GntR family transcriptional regulator n=1 Tax=Polaromonas sp. TaxID=1869339 RepID=UPI00356A3454
MDNSALSGTFQCVITEPAYKAVSAAIERAIIGGALPPGTALPTEQDLSERFGVHRSTVREAIRQVEQEGLLQRRASRRLYVCLPGINDLAPRATRLLLLQETTFREMWEVALAIEPLSARLAAQYATEEDLELLEANFDAGLASSDLPTLVALDTEFHALVGRASHNSALMLAREPISLLYNTALLQIFERLPQGCERNVTAHRRILDALRSRDGEAAAHWTHKHMVDFQRGFALAGLDMSSPLVKSK